MIVNGKRFLLWGWAKPVINWALLRMTTLLSDGQPEFICSHAQAKRLNGSQETDAMFMSIPLKRLCAPKSF